MQVARISHLGGVNMVTRFPGLRLEFLSTGVVISPGLLQVALEPRGRGGSQDWGFLKHAVTNEPLKWPF